MDESGDLGFDFAKEKTPRNFVIVFLMVKNDNAINKAVAKVYKSIPQKYRKHIKGGALHCAKESAKVRIKMLSLLKDIDASVMAIILNKKNVFTKMKDEKPIFYNYIVNILLDRIANKNVLSKNDKINFIASQRETNKFLNENFKNYIETQTYDKHKVNINVNVQPFYNVKGLQAVDFISWAIFKKYENSERYFYNIIKKLIVEEYTLFE
jgi:undecaprenyl pyrophosphate synthase